jgi:exonuclease SbcC
VIERLVLKDFKSHEDSDIEFNQGLNIFLGEVGAGKTSIFEAISFALFGRYAGSIHQGGLIRRGAETAEVSLTFSTQTGRYRIDRVIYPEKTQQVKMWVLGGGEWQLAVEGATAVSKSVEDLLNVDTSTFLAAIYASQGEIKEMLETQPGKRRERLDKLLGLDTYENIWKTLGDAKTLVLTELTHAQDQASGVDVLEQQLDALKARITRNKKEVGQLQASLNRIGKQLTPTEQRLKDLDALRSRLTTVRTQVEGKVAELNKSNQALTALRERLQKAVDAAQVFEQNQAFIARETTLEAEKRRVDTALQRKANLELLRQRDEGNLTQARERQSRLATQLKELKTLETELETLEAERNARPALEKAQVRLGERLDAVKTDLVTALNEMDNQKQKVARVTELGECPTCLQPVPDEHKERIRNETQGLITKLEAEYTALEASQAQVQGQLEEVRKQLERAETADRNYVATATKISLLVSRREELEMVEAQIHAVKATLDDTQQKIGAIPETPETLNELETWLKEVHPKADAAREAERLAAVKTDLEALLLAEENNHTTLQGQLRTLEASQTGLEETYDAEDHAEVERRVRALQDDRAKALEGLARLTASIDDDRLHVETVTKGLAAKRVAKKTVERLKAEDSVIEVLRRSLREVVQPVMRKNNVLGVSEAFQGFYQELSNDSIDYAAIDEEGNIDITRNGEPSPVNSLSGGETTCAALALRLAICSSLTRNQLLLLDEPTIHLDEVYRAKLRDFLGTHSFEQLVVVTHDNTFDSLPAKIFRVEKRRGRSVVAPLRMGGN